MQAINFEEILNRILEKDSRYHRQSYLFVRDGLEHTQKRASNDHPTEVRHISGQELLEGLREFGLSEFGPMARTVLIEWGVRRCEDFGEIVFNMVDAGLLRKTETDSRADFQGGYDFDEAFCKPFRPARAPDPAVAPRQSKPSPANPKPA